MKMLFIWYHISVFVMRVLGVSSPENEATFISKAVIVCESMICNASEKYRSLDGCCNNIQNKTWGVALSTRPRLSSAYFEGEYGFRKTASGKSLPEPRQITLSIDYDKNYPTKNISHFFTFFGQNVAHDITLTPVQDPRNCCSEVIPDKSICVNLNVETNDPFYSIFNLTCLSFVRSINSGIDKGKLQFPNTVTSAIDLSFTYGSSLEINQLLRGSGGTLLFQQTAQGDLLPQNRNDPFCPLQYTKECFFAGDSRVNQHTLIMSLQTIWMREHNRLVNELGLINPAWDNETLFQEARRIAGATFQSIVYNEYLPVLLGEEIMSEYGLWLSSNGSVYDSEIDFSVSIEFGGGLFRLHSMVGHLVKYENISIARFKDHYLNPMPIHEGFMSNLLKGVTSVPSQCFDRHLSTDVWGFLYKRPNVTYGQDIGAIDIQRGREFGLPSYTQMLSDMYENSIELSSFEDLALMEQIEQSNIDLLRENYENVQDVDLWVGMNLETIKEGSVLGPTATVITADQFQKLKDGDRFFFTHKGLPTSFTDEQMDELLKASIGRIICDNTELMEMPLNSMLMPSDTNIMQSCDEFPIIDLQMWKE